MIYCKNHFKESGGFRQTYDKNIEANLSATYMLSVFSYKLFQISMRRSDKKQVNNTGSLLIKLFSFYLTFLHCFSKLFKSYFKKCPKDLSLGYAKKLTIVYT